MGRPWSTDRPGDIISRPLPVSLAISPTFSFFPRSYEPPGKPGAPTKSLNGSTLSGGSRSIKYGSGKHAGVELVPQPSDYPEDPLNWPRWRKDLNLLSLLIMVGLIGGMKTAFIPTAGSLLDHYQVSMTCIAALTAVPLMVSAMTGVASATVARFWGKRPIYLISAFVLFVGTVWNATAGDKYGSCLGSRVFQGLGWGAFDVLVNGSIQDTYFEHERGLLVTMYNIITITTTWGSPLLGGLASSNANSVTKQFQVISCLYLLAFPLLAFAAAETTFDRPRAALAPVPSPALNAWRPWRFRHRVNKTTILGYLAKMKPFSFHAPMTRAAFFQAPRALMAPTTCLISILTFIPFGALWGLTSSISFITSPAPLSLGSSLTGVLMAGPCIAAAVCFGVFSSYGVLRGRITRRVSRVILCTGTAFVLVGLLSYGLGLDSFMTSRPSPSDPIFSSASAGKVNLPLLSLQLGLLAGGSYMLDSTTAWFIIRSASFTSSSMVVAERSVVDMQSGVLVLRNLAAGIFVAALPNAVTVHGGLKATVIGLATTQLLITTAMLTIWWRYDESIWRADGLTMKLIDLRLLKQTASLFETDSA